MPRMRAAPDSSSSAVRMNPAPAMTRMPVKIDHGGVAGGERQPDRGRVATLGDELAGRVVDHRDVVEVEGVHQPTEVGDRRHADGHRARGAGHHAERQQTEPDQVQTRRSPRTPPRPEAGTGRPHAPRSSAATAGEQGGSVSVVALLVMQIDLASLGTPVRTSCDATDIVCLSKHPLCSSCEAEEVQMSDVNAEHVARQALSSSRVGPADRRRPAGRVLRPDPARTADRHPRRARCPVKALAAATGLAPNTVSQALTSLREAGLVQCRREGRFSRGGSRTPPLTNSCTTSAPRTASYTRLIDPALISGRLIWSTA